MPACPNHMNAPLSYADPARIEAVTVYSGITPVSVGRRQPRRLDPGPLGAARVRARRRAGAPRRGHRRRLRTGATAAPPATACAPRPPATLAPPDGQPVGRLDGEPPGGRRVQARRAGPRGRAGRSRRDEIASSAYRGALRALARPRGAQRRPTSSSSRRASRPSAFEGFPNQRMDMTITTTAPSPSGTPAVGSWGVLEARPRLPDHPPRDGHGAGPLRLRGRDAHGHPGEDPRGGASRRPCSPPGGRRSAAGAEWQDHTLFDWWPPVGGAMGPNAFWNVDFGQRRTARRLRRVGGPVEPAPGPASSASGATRVTHRRRPGPGLRQRARRRLGRRRARPSTPPGAAAPTANWDAHRVWRVHAPRSPRLPGRATPARAGPPASTSASPGPPTRWRRS